MKRSTLMLTAVAIAGLLAAAPASADIIANYTFSDDSFASSDTDANSAASDLTLGDGLTADVDFDSVGNPAPALNFHPSNFSPNFGDDPGDYLAFTISTGAMGGITEWESLTMDTARTHTGITPKLRLMASTDDVNFDQIGSELTENKFEHLYLYQSQH